MSFKYGYMTQRSAFFTKAGMGRNLPAQKEGAEPPDKAVHSHVKEILAKRTSRLEMLDSPASRDQVDDSNNQSDHQ
jgi:hypothetical protein